MATQQYSGLGEWRNLQSREGTRVENTSGLEEWCHRPPDTHSPRTGCALVGRKVPQYVTTGVTAVAWGCMILLSWQFLIFEYY